MERVGKLKEKTTKEGNERQGRETGEKREEG